MSTSLNIFEMNDNDIIKLASDSGLDTNGKSIDNIRNDIASMYGIDMSRESSIESGQNGDNSSPYKNVVEKVPTSIKETGRSNKKGRSKALRVEDNNPMIPKPIKSNEPDFGGEINQSKMSEAYDYTKLLDIPPIRRVTAPVEEVDPGIPGTIKLDESGKLQKTFFVFDGLASNNTRTFDHFIQERIPMILGSRSVKINDGKDKNGRQLYRIISFVNPLMTPPGIRSRDDFEKIYPLMAQNTGSDYVGELWANAIIRDQDGKIINDPIQVFLGSLPVMIRSSLCNTKKLSDQDLVRVGFDPKDPGGYFIMGGAEKVVLIQENLRVNQISTYCINNSGDLLTKMTCSTIRGTSVVILSYDDKAGIIKYKYGGSDQKLDVINALLPFRLLGELVNNGKSLSADDIWNYIVPFIDTKDLKRVLRKLQGTFADLATVKDTRAAVSYLADHKAMKTDTKWKKMKTLVEKEGGPLEDEITDIKDGDAHESHITAVLTGNTRNVGGGIRGLKKQVDNAKLEKLTSSQKKEILQKDMLRVLFPQLDNDANGTSKKLYMLGMMIARFGQVLAGVRKPDDRDDWGNKQLKSPGLMMEQLFTSIWNSMVNKLQENINQQGSNINFKNLVNNIDSTLMTRTFYKSFTSTKWGLRRTDAANITDILKRASLAEMASYITKISTPADKNVKKPEIRMVQGSQLGFVCPIDTPEGSSCLTLDTQILTGDGYSSVSIDNIKDGKTNVMSFNTTNSKFSPGKTDNYFEFEAKDKNKKLYKITTISGRSIKATEDHPFWTNNTWTNVNKLKEGDLLSVLHHTINLPKHSNTDLIILNNKIIKNILSNCYSISNDKINSFINKLKNINLCPLTSNNDKLYIISRIAGYIVANGTICVNNDDIQCLVDFDTKRDAKDLENDISALGIGKSTIKLLTTELTDKKYYWHLQNKGILGLLLLSLGFKNESVISSVPEWIMCGSQMVKREFVSSFQGGNGREISYYNNGNFKTFINDITGNANDIAMFMDQILSIFISLGIDAMCIHKYTGYKKHKTSSLCILSTEDNIIKYMDIIGYRYCFRKSNIGGKVYEYLKYKSLKINSCEGSNLLTINEFYEMYEPVGDTLRVPIYEIKEIPSECVADFSVPNGNESFVANGFVVHNCGLVKHLSITCRISVEHGEGLVNKVLRDNNYISLRKTSENDTICLINSIIIGWCNGYGASKFLIEKRRNLEIYSDICVYHNSRFRELLIFTNAGRPTRPLLVVDTSDDDNPRLVIEKKNLWSKPYEDLLTYGAVEYIDALEQNQDNIIIAMSVDDFKNSHLKVQEARASLAELESYKSHIENIDFNSHDKVITQFGEQSEEINVQNIEDIIKNLDNDINLAKSVLDNLIIQSSYTHCELDPTALMGISASLIPLSNHNQGPRNIYQASMGKQALGLVHSAVSHRMDNMKALAFPTRPFFATQSSQWLGMDEVPAGQTVTLAFMSYTGYNQEDAILINEAALKRGAFRYTVYHNYKASNKTSNDSKEVFEKPKTGRGESDELYSALNDNGIPQIGKKVKEDYYIIGRVRKTPLKDGTEKVDNISTPLPVGIDGVVDRVLISVQNGIQTIKVRIRQTRIPVRGDKFASRHAQKSTVGLVVAEEDIPRTLDGRRPTIIINPLCIPSRMTLGMVLELLGSKAAVMLGERINATSFRNFTPNSNIFNELQITLKEYGFDKVGNETMVSGITGETFSTPIFIGPVYYQLLKHLVQYKYHARGGTGAVSMLTRQPVPGRIKGGGLRTGEMERDSFISHGAASLLKGKLCDQSDAFISVYCRQCGIPARHSPHKGAKCPSCKSDEFVGSATTPYSYQLLANFVRGVGFRPKLIFADKSPSSTTPTL